MPLYRFHKNHGTNVRLSESREAAKRSTSFANAITFSENPLKSGEIFMVEVEEQEMGWSGHLRCGLTQHCPSKMMPFTHGAGASSMPSEDSEEEVHVIPQYSMPDLTSMGKSWIFAITKHHNKVPRTIQNDDDEHGASEASTFIQNCGNALQVGNRFLPPNLLVKDFGSIELESSQSFKQGGSNGQKLYLNRKQVMATSIGSRIGITYEVQRVNSESKLFMHLIINGEDQGSSLMENADPDSPFYAIVDVYGTTKQVNIIQLNYVPSLQECCRMGILIHTKQRGVERLPLPHKLKRFLNFEYL